MALYTPVVYAADVGSEAKGRLAWCRVSGEATTPDQTGESLEGLATYVAADLAAGLTVALGFECPLAIDLRATPADLTKARNNEGNRAWCAGAGAGALAVGLAQCAWVFGRIGSLKAPARPTFSWPDLVAGRANLLVWEAFVSNKTGDHSHHGDALKAALAFQRAVIAPAGPQSMITFDSPYSLAGAALLRAGLTDDLTVLHQPCLVIRG